MKKIKILQVVGSLKMGGKQKVALNINKYIDDNTFEFDYLVFGNTIGELESEIKELHGNILRIPSPNRNYITFIKNIRSILNKYGPYDVVHSHPLFNSGFIMKAAFLENIPIRIAHSHGARFNERELFLKKIYNFQMRKNIKKFCTHALACSKDAGIYLFGEKWFEENGMIIKNGINLNEFTFNENTRLKLRKEFNLINHYVIGHIGRISEVKNQSFILNLLKKVKEDNYNTKLMLIGDGDKKQELIQKATELDLSNDVLFLGSRNDANLFLNSMDLFLFPSKYEGLGIALIEAQANGLHCITSTEVPEESIVTNIVEKIPLTFDEDSWVKQILSNINNTKRKETFEDLTISGYNIKSTIMKVKKIYKGIN